VCSGDGGIRTHTVHVLSVATPAGWSTSPCRQCAGQESNLRSGARRFYRPRGLPGPTDACCQWHGWESNPQTPRFELGRYAGSRTVPFLIQAPQTGFEPVTSTLTEWRANQAAPQGRNRSPISFQSPRWESNPRFRHTKTAGSRYNTGASQRVRVEVRGREKPSPACSPTPTLTSTPSERPVGVEPTHPPWRGGRRPLHHGRVSTLCGSRARLGGLRGRRPHPKSNRACHRQWKRWESNPRRPV
jgi:hypothetical protein